MESLLALIVREEHQVLVPCMAGCTGLLRKLGFG